MNNPFKIGDKVRLFNKSDTSFFRSTRYYPPLNHTDEVREVVDSEVLLKNWFIGIGRGREGEIELTFRFSRFEKI
jgi:hypothetical protein